MPDLSRALVTVEVEAPLLGWMGVHGALTLALRHPGIGTVPAARAMLLQFLAHA